MVDPQLIPLAIASVADILWDFVDLKDILSVSICSRSFAQLPVPAQNLNRLVKRNGRYNGLGQMKLAFAHDLTAGLVRRVMNRFQTSLQATLIVDDRSGRIILDIGSAFNDNDAFLAHEVTTVEPETPNSDLNAQLIKEIEISSYDEYDDFNPRHPAMKDRAHRRGDSLFNSDLDFVGNELHQRNMSRGGSHGFDLSSIAAQAAQQEASSKESRTASVRDRIMAKKKPAGLPPVGKPNNTEAH